MVVLQINATYGVGSTGRICAQISNSLTNRNIENYAAYSLGKSLEGNSYKFSSPFLTKLYSLKARVFGSFGFEAIVSTKRLISYIKKVNPDVVLIHNIHSHDVNIKMLFDFLNKQQIKVYYTFHDCWAFTGYCPYFTYCNCNKWAEKSGCSSCIQKKNFSWIKDRSHKNFLYKKECLSKSNMTIICPSKWMAEVTKSSFLGKKEILVVNNGIDLEKFNYIENAKIDNELLKGKRIILGVAYKFDKRKGIDYFIEISKRIPKDFVIVLVGKLEKGTKLPDSIVHIEKTDSQEKLAELYSSAAVFVNPTREDNFPTTHIESLACGTPVVTFDVGGSKEVIEEGVGAFVAPGDIEAMTTKIIQIASAEKDVKKCREVALHYNYQSMSEKYADILTK